MGLSASQTEETDASEFEAMWGKVGKPRKRYWEECPARFSNSFTWVKYLQCERGDVGTLLRYQISLVLI